MRESIIHRCLGLLRTPVDPQADSKASAEPASCAAGFPAVEARRVLARKAEAGPGQQRDVSGNSDG